MSTQQFREELNDMIGRDFTVRITGILDVLGIAHLSWYRKFIPASQGKRTGPAGKPIPEQIVRVVIQYAKLYPWYSYKKIAVICRRASYKVKNRHAWRVMTEYGLLHKRHRSAVGQSGDVSVRNRLLKQCPHSLGCLYKPAAEPTNNRAVSGLCDLR